MDPEITTKLPPQGARPAAARGLAVAELGIGAASLGSFLSPAQLFVYAITTAVSIPCIATLATLVAEFGRRAAFAMTAATLAIALLAGGILARLLGIA